MYTNYPKIILNIHVELFCHLGIIFDENIFFKKPASLPMVFLNIIDQVRPHALSRMGYLENISIRTYSFKVFAILIKIDKYAQNWFSQPVFFFFFSTQKSLCLSDYEMKVTTS